MESEAEKNSDRTGQTISLSILLLLAVTYSLYSFQANEQTYRLDLHDLKTSKKKLGKKLQFKFFFDFFRTR